MLLLLLVVVVVVVVVVVLRRPDWLWGLFPMGKAPWREVDHSPPVSAEVKKIWIYTSTLPYAFMELCFIS
jgi:hypothetical protein